MHDQASSDPSDLEAKRRQGRVKSFSRRGGRMIRRYRNTLREHGPRYVLDLPRGDSPTTIADDARVDLAAAFGNDEPVVVEIGPGSGEQLVSYAKSHPDRNVLAFEAWHVAVARCVANAVRNDVTNVRIVEADAAQALPVVFADPATPRARELWTFFPDPWRKKRHRKRRLVAGPFVAQAAGVLKSGGLGRLATDWDDYAWQMRDELEDSDSFANLYAGQRLDPSDPEPLRGGFAPRWPERVMTRFEQRGVDAGRTIRDLAFRRA